MNPEQVELLFQANQSPELSGEQRNRLTLSNPWTQKGSIAQFMQRRVAQLNPIQAKAWIAEAGASMSLQAAAAQQGLAPITPAIQAELERMNLLTEKDIRQAKVAEILSQGNPYGSAAHYVDGPNGEPVLMPETKGNFTNASMLEQLCPKTAAEQKAASQPAAPAHSFTDREVAILRAHGYAIPGEA